MMNQKSYLEKLKNQINKNCCLNITDTFFTILFDMFLKIIVTYLDTAKKLAKHSDRNTILLKDIHLAQDFIDNEIIIISTEINCDKYSQLKNNYPKDDTNNFEYVGGKKLTKELEKYFTSKEFKALCTNYLPKNINIDTRASNNMLETITEFLDGFMNQCKKHCDTKKSDTLSHDDAYYLIAKS
jgi:histone H3/H4